jgi:hypothetical protein
MKIKILRFIGWLVIGLCLVGTLMIRFGNPELTETQLFVEHWLEWLILAIGYIGGMWLVEAKFKKG